MNGDDEKIKIDEISQSLGNRTNESGETAKHFIHTLFSTIAGALKKEDRVPIYQFGSFKKTWVEERPGVNPQTGNDMRIPEHYRVSFTPSSNLAEAVNWKYNFAESYDFPSQEEPISIPLEESKNDPADLEDNTVMEPSIDQPVNQRETRALLGTEEENRRMERERQRALIAVLSAAVLVVCLLALLFAIPVNGRGGLEAAERQAGENPVEVVAREQDKEKPSQTTKTDHREDQSTGKREEQTNKSPEESAKENTKQENNQRERITKHTVKGGDTLVSITEKYWEDAHLWPDMYSNNNDVLNDPNLLFPGQMIEVLESLGTSKGFSPEAKEELLGDYIMVYRLYRSLGEKEAKRNRNSGESRFREARTVLYTATMYDSDILEIYRSRINPRDYEILSDYIEKNGTYSPENP